MTTPKTFEVGTIYTTGEGRSHVWRFKVLGRSAKFIMIADVSDIARTPGTTVETHRVGVKFNSDGSEWALPLGRYSMAPVINADTPYVPFDPDEDRWFRQAEARRRWADHRDADDLGSRIEGSSERVEP